MLKLFDLLSQAHKKKTSKRMKGRAGWEREKKWEKFRKQRAPGSSPKEEEGGTWWGMMLAKAFL